MWMVVAPLYNAAMDKPVAAYFVVGPCSRNDTGQFVEDLDDERLLYKLVKPRADRLDLGRCEEEFDEFSDPESESALTDLGLVPGYVTFAPLSKLTDEEAVIPNPAILFAGADGPEPRLNVEDSGGIDARPVSPG